MKWFSILFICRVKNLKKKKKKKKKMWKVYDNDDNGDDGQRRNFDQKSSLEPSAQVSLKWQGFNAARGFFDITRVSIFGSCECPWLQDNRDCLIHITLKLRPLFIAYDLCTGKKLYRGTPAVTGSLGFCGTTTFSRLVSQAKGSERLPVLPHELKNT